MIREIERTESKPLFPEAFPPGTAFIPLTWDDFWQEIASEEIQAMTYTYETHLHTRQSSRCGRTPGRDYIKYYQDQGYSGIVVTDHFYGNPCYVPDKNASWAEQVNVYCSGYEEAYNEGIRCGFPVFFGIEQQFADDEALIYGPDKQWLLDHPDIFTWGRRKWFDEVEAIGGCIVLAHPFRVRDYVTKITVNTCVHAVEVFNGGNRPEDDVYALRYGQYYHYPMTAGTDMHLIGKPESLYGVVFEKPWVDIFSYARAIRQREPFGVRAPEGRGKTELKPLERPYEYLNKQEHPVPWDVQEILG